MVLPAVGEPESLQARTRRLEPPAPGQAVVRKEATGGSFAAPAEGRGKYENQPGLRGKDYNQPEFPFVPGYDLVGTVEELGAGPRAGVRLGQRVAALTKNGGW